MKRYRSFLNRFALVSAFLTLVSGCKFQLVIGEFVDDQILALEHEILVTQRAACGVQRVLKLERNGVEGFLDDEREMISEAMTGYLDYSERWASLGVRLAYEYDASIAACTLSEKALHFNPGAASLQKTLIQSLDMAAKSKRKPKFNVLKIILTSQANPENTYQVTEEEGRQVLRLNINAGSGNPFMPFGDLVMTAFE